MKFEEIKSYKKYAKYQIKLTAESKKQIAKREEKYKKGKAQGTSVNEQKLDSTTSSSHGQEANTANSNATDTDIDPD